MPNHLWNFKHFIKMLSILPPGMNDSSNENLTDSSDEDISARPRHDDADEGNSLQLDGKSTQPPRGVSQIQWEKFLELQKDREQIPSSVDMMTGRNRKRRRHRKRRCKNKEGSNIEGYGSSNAERKDGESSASSSLIGPQLPGQHSEHPGQHSEHPGQQQKWNEIKDYLWVHDRFKGVNYGKVSEMSGLEKEIESAITAKDFKTAEKLSDHLANRGFGAQIHDAIKAKEYVAKQEKEKMEKSQKKKKRKLAWRFEAKERWEMKGNM